MNEIIAKLTQQCYEYNETMQGTWFNKTKFAELIVQECMDQCFTDAERIAQHFGIDISEEE